MFLFLPGRHPPWGNAVFLPINSFFQKRRRNNCRSIFFQVHFQDLKIKPIRLNLRRRKKSFNFIKRNARTSPPFLALLDIDFRSQTRPPEILKNECPLKFKILKKQLFRVIVKCTKIFLHLALFFFFDIQRNWAAKLFCTRRKTTSLNRTIFKNQLAAYTLTYLRRFLNRKFCNFLNLYLKQIPWT